MPVFRGTVSNEAEEAVASSLFCARKCARIGDIIKLAHACARSKLHHYDRLTRTINRDLMLAKTNSSIDDDFLTKRGGKVT